MILHRVLRDFFSFFFKDTATTEIYTLSLHDALPIFWRWRPRLRSELTEFRQVAAMPSASIDTCAPPPVRRSEEHTSELQSLTNLVCRLLLEKKNKNDTNIPKLTKFMIEVRDRNTTVS